MKNDKICPICGGLMIFSIKILGNKKIKLYLCLECGHVDVIEDFYYLENHNLPYNLPYFKIKRNSWHKMFK